jgi:hypothetical protein
MFLSTCSTYVKNPDAYNIAGFISHLMLDFNIYKNQKHKIDQVNLNEGILCKICGKYGHYAKECRLQKKFSKTSHKGKINKNKKGEVKNPCYFMRTNGFKCNGKHSSTTCYYNPTSKEYKLCTNCNKPGHVQKDCKAKGGGKVNV